jgi:hypothetical protein
MTDARKRDERGLNLDFSPCVWKGGTKQAAEKRSNAVILSPFTVILSAAKNLALPAQGKLREGSRSEHFQGNARFFVAAAPQNDSALEFFRSLFSPVVARPP